MIKLMRSTRHTLRFNDLASCTYDIIELGCSYSYLHSELMENKILSHLETLFQKRTADNEYLEILAIAYQACKNMVVEHREEVCSFIDKCSELFIKFFRKNDLSEKMKAIRIKFLDIILIAHFPFDDKGGYEKEKETNPPNWMTMTRESENFIKHELAISLVKYRDKESGLVVDQVFAQCAARFSYYFYWKFESKDDMPRNDDDDEPTTSKRARMSNKKMDAILELIKPDPTSLEKFNWKWFTVLVEMITNHRKSLSFEDIPKILKILSECQSTIAYSFQVYAFTKCCYVLLQQSSEALNKHVSE